MKRHVTGQWLDADPHPELAGRDRLGWGHVLRDGFGAGLLGAVVVAVFFVIVGLAAGAPFALPRILGSLLPGVRDAEPSAILAGYVLLAAVFVAGGLVLAWAVAQLQNRPGLGVLLVFGFAGFSALLLAFAWFFAGSLYGRLGAGSLVASLALAGTAMLALLMRRHPWILHGPDRLWHASREESLRSEDSEPGAPPRTREGSRHHEA